jgi:hypothetical protein
MTTHEPKEPTNNEQLQTIREGVEKIKLIVNFPIEYPGERRADSKLPDGFEYTMEQENEIRRIASEKLGIGLPEDLTPEMAGLHKNGLTIIEGGQSHKMLAELALVINSDCDGPIVISATEYRKIKSVEDDPKVKERLNTATLLGISEDQVGSTELEVAVQVAESLPEFIKLDSARAVTENLKQLGTVDGRNLYLYSIPRQYYTDENGSQKYTKPSAAEQAIELTNIIGAPDVALVTSSTYYSSRAIVGQGAYKVVAYCPATLARVRGQDSTGARADLTQILSEVAKIDKQLQ